MRKLADKFIQNFIRNLMTPFKVGDFRLWLSNMGIRTSIEECKKFLDENGNIFSVGEFYATRAYLFTNKFFSFKPTRKEINRGVFITGDRCIPFVDSESLSCDLQFIYNGKPLPKKIIDYPSDDAIDLFLLYGEEFATQYIAADPANKGLDLAKTDFLLPNTVKMTSFSLDPIIQAEGFSSGDRILCRVTNWNDGIVEIYKILKNDTPFKSDKHTLAREEWYKKLENFLEKSFKSVGPCSMIEEQLALVFAAHSDELCIKDCGGIEEFFQHSKKIGLELFGVETRIWYKNEEVPAIGVWNRNETKDSAKKCKKREPIFERLPKFIEDAYLKDALYFKKDNLTEILDALYPHLYCFDDNLKTNMLLHLKTRHAILEKNYNRFADYEMSAIRKKVLELFTVVNEMVCTMGIDGPNLADYPQQPLVILSQIYEHIIHIIDRMENCPAEIANEVEEVSLAIEGMEFNFNEIYAPLRKAIDKNMRNGFSVIKK